ncbi:MAG: hypothetical protein QOG79_1226 [Mycobacterium sp.]|jgi:hypothetical protein|nr:hypothetical protein [Mycobacterium sp.]MDT5297984.1 hypothetical protein [Mycobacterium sp.]
MTTCTAPWTSSSPGHDGGAPAELWAVVSAHLSPHFTTAVSQDAQENHSVAAFLARDAILAALDRYTPPSTLERAQRLP